MKSEYLTLKWGTLKSWNAESEAARGALQAYYDSGPTSMSAMMQHDNEAQKQALCDLIDAIDGEIWLDWSGEQVTKEQAKAYVIDYGKASA